MNLGMHTQMDVSQKVSDIGVLLRKPEIIHKYLYAHIAFSFPQNDGEVILEYWPSALKP